MKHQIIWGKIQKKDNGEYAAGELIEVGLFRRALAMHYNPKYQKIIKVSTFER